ncbi:hypothetical protein O9G_004845, partial [Rozella allomycis CSF55]
RFLVENAGVNNFVQERIKRIEEKDEKFVESVLYEANCGDLIIGVFVVDIFKDKRNSLSISHPFNLYNYFEIECPMDSDGVNLKHGRIETFFIDLNFYGKTRLFLKEICRRAKLDCLFFCLDPEKKAYENSIMNSFTWSVKPKRFIAHSDTHSHPGFSVRFFSLNASQDLKIDINSSIVLVGCSDVSISMLETFLLNRNYNFRNLTIISPFGIEEKQCYWNGEYSKEKLDRLGLFHSLNVVAQNLVGIDRDKKIVSTEFGLNLNYDYLVLATGVEYNQLEFLKDCDSQNGVFNFNRSILEDLTRELQRELHQEVAIFTNDLHGLAAVSLATDLGIPLQKISLIFNEINQNEFLSEIELLKHNGLKIYNSKIKECKFQDSRMNSIILDNQDELQCNLFINASNKQPSTQMINILNQSFLTVDAKLIIDQNCKTNDNFIYAAGPLTRFSSKYNTLWEHSFLNSRQVGINLANRIIRLTTKDNSDPFLDFESYYSDPIVLNHSLPMQRMLLDIKKPLIPHLKLETPVKKIESNANNQYCSLEINANGYIQRITILASEANMKTKNYSFLYNKHHKLLLNLLSRYEDGLVPDLLQFINNLANYHLYSQDVEDLYHELGSIISGQADNPVIEKIRNAQTISSREMLELFNEWQQFGVRETLHDRVIEYVNTVSI